MFFYKKQGKTKEADNESFFKYRDGLSGLKNREFVFKEHERLKHSKEYFAVAIRLSGCESMPYYKACESIERAGGLLSRICEAESARIENGDFVIFSKDGAALTEKLNFFLGRLSEEDEVLCAVCDMLDKNESFEVFIRRIQRHLAAAELENVMQKR